MKISANMFLTYKKLYRNNLLIHQVIKIETKQIILSRAKCNTKNERERITFDFNSKPAIRMFMKHYRSTEYLFLRMASNCTICHIMLQCKFFSLSFVINTESRRTPIKPLLTRTGTQKKSLHFLFP